jgi:hypothetical protein
MFALLLDGRKFRSGDRDFTVSQIDYIAAQLRLAGAPESLNDPARPEEERADITFTKILEAGRSFHILAGLFTEDGQVWVRAKAEANAARFADITALAEKRAMWDALMTFIVGLLETSQNGRSSPFLIH